MRDGQAVAPPPQEKAVYEAVARILTLAGCQVYRLAQSRATRQTAGLPDLWVFGPTGGAWIEVKRPGGRLRPEQRVFRERCQARRIEHVVGGLEQVEALLVRWGLAEPIAGGVRLTPQRAARGTGDGWHGRGGTTTQHQANVFAGTTNDGRLADEVLGNADTPSA